MPMLFITTMHFRQRYIITILIITLTVAMIPMVSESSGEENSGSLIFTDVATSAGVDFQHIRSGDLFSMGGGVAVFDFNNDGLLDIYVTNSGGPNDLYRNDGGMMFSNIAVSAGVDDPLGNSNGVCAGDYDNDGNVDLFLANYGTSKLFHNNGVETFTDVTAAAQVGDLDPSYRSMGCAFGDYNNDSYLDLIVVRYLHDLTEDQGNWDLSNGQRGVSFTDSVRPLSLFTNDGDGTFTDDTMLLGDPTANPGTIQRAGFQPMFFDYDNDGDTDIHVCNDFDREIGPNVLWRNDGQGPTDWIFTDVSTSSNIEVTSYCMGTAVGDYDNNGFLDLYHADGGPNNLLKNIGGVFSDTTNQAGVGRELIPGPSSGVNIGWGTIFFDADNDGDVDLYFVAGILDNTAFNNFQPNGFFENNGDLTFTDVSIQSGTDDSGVGRGLGFGDFNNDGCVDMYVVNLGRYDPIAGIQGDPTVPGTSLLFQNDCTNTNNWLAIKTIGSISNADGIGARIKVSTTNGEQIREVAAGGSHISQNMLRVHFGLSDATQADVEIRWPSGVIQTLANVAPNQIIEVTEYADGQTGANALIGAASCGNGICESDRGEEDAVSCPADCSAPAQDCGDGNIDPGEACDGSDLGGFSCTGLGFPGGSLSCDASCNFDTGGCNPASCGDGICGLDRFGNEETTESCDVDCPAPPVADCGNNVIENPEVCDGTDFGGLTCLDFGFGVEGELTCSFDSEGNPCSQITLDQCLPLCGNFELDPGETCENVIISPPDPPVFNDNCRPNFCTSCGDSNIDFQEECDDGNLDNDDGCSEFCILVPVTCGDGVATGEDDCDGEDLNGRDCLSLGFDGGSLSCSASCRYDTDACTGTGPICGDPVVTVPIEQCDGTDLLGQTCNDFGFDGGTLGCTTTCKIDTGACMFSPFCGDSAATGLEECDGEDFLEQTCNDFGFVSGALSCTKSCQIDSNACNNDVPICGDGAITVPHEQCDGTDLLGQTCSDLGFLGGTLVCDPFDCQFDITSCTNDISTCGDGVANGLEKCDGESFNGRTCTDFGFDGGTLGCTATCKIDTEACTETSVSEGTIVTGVATTPQLCGGVILDGTAPVSHQTTFNNQPSSQETMRIGNTGSGPATGELIDVGDFNDKMTGFLFSGCEARWSSFAGDLYADMNGFCDFSFSVGPPFIEVLPGKAAPGDPRTSVDRFIRTLPQIDPDKFMPVDMGGLGDPIVAASKHTLAISCTPEVAMCAEGFEEVNGACLCTTGFELDGNCLEACPVDSLPNEQKRECECDAGFFPFGSECIVDE